MKKTGTLEIVFSVIIVLTSTLNLLMWNLWVSSPSYNIPGQVVSVLGIMGVIFYFRRLNIGNTLIYIWSIAQTLVIVLFENGQQIPILNLSQVFQFPVIGYESYSSTDFVVRFNFISLVYLWLSYRIYLSSLKGARFLLKSYREEGVLTEALPAYATILKRVKVRKETDWMLVKLEGISDGVVRYAILKPKDKNERLKPKKLNQMLSCVLLWDKGVTEWSIIPEEALGKGDWAYIAKE